MAPAAGRPLYIGQGFNQLGAAAFFAGTIDEPCVLSVAGGSPVTLPQLVPMVTNSPAVYYDAQGFLNMAYNPSDVYIAVGDPYQKAPLLRDNGATIVVTAPNPLPVTGGFVLLGTEVIQYTGISGGNTLNGLTRNYKSIQGPVGSGGAAGQVYFARLVDVDTTGLVQMVPNP